MALHYCQSCQSLEQGITYEPDADVYVCDECGSDEIEFVTEHDDYDMER
jgi:predicted RNA-binding Zn-ribbon protein involved in translation (DUF1610 family)